jgi:hypothetical protein
MAEKSRILEQSDQSIFFNVIPSPSDERDWAAEPLYDDVKRIPSNLDWRGHIQRVRNQGRQGTSLAFAGTCILEWYSRKILKCEITASAQFLYNARPDKTRTLMSPRDLMETLRTSGCCKEETYAYGSKFLPTPEIFEEASKFKIDGYAKIRTMETLKRALLVNGPCLISFPVFNHTTKLWKQRKEHEKLGCHAMAVVGYNTKGFIVRNSWGEHWDTDGYCIYPYDDWGCHDEIWTVVNEQNLVQWKLRERNTIVKRFSAFSLVMKEEDEGERTEGEGEVGVEKNMKVEDDALSQDKNPLPVPREKVMSSVVDEYQEFGQKEKISGTNEMNKRKSLVSKMFGSRSVAEVPVSKGEEESEVILE